MNQDKKGKIKAILQEWASAVLAQWHRKALNIDELVSKIVAVLEEES